MPTAPIVIADSITRIADAARGAVVVNASHGGVYAAYLAAKLEAAAAVFNDAGGGREGAGRETGLKYDVRAAFYNDAGIGVDEAGVSRLPALDRRGIAAATVAAMSARIGDARSSYADGMLSRVNPRAAALGLKPG